MYDISSCRGTSLLLLEDVQSMSLEVCHRADLGGHLEIRHLARQALQHGDLHRHGDAAAKSTIQSLKHKAQDETSARYTQHAPYSCIHFWIHFCMNSNYSLCGSCQAGHCTNSNHNSSRSCPHNQFWLGAKGYTCCTCFRSTR